MVNIWNLLHEKLETLNTKARELEQAIATNAAGPDA